MAETTESFGGAGDAGGYSPYLRPIAENPFRTLGLSAHAAQADVFAKLDRLKRAAKLGASRPSGYDLPQLGNCSRDDFALQGALSALNQPMERLRARIFALEAELPPALSTLPLVNWFEVLAEPTHFDLISVHDQAILLMLPLFQEDVRLQHPMAWRQFIQCWKTLLLDETYWDMLAQVEHTGGFELQPTAEEWEQLRKEVPLMVLNGFLRLAQQALIEGRVLMCEQCIQMLDKAELPAEWHTQALAQITSGLESRYQEEIETLTQMKVATEALHYFQQTIEPLLYRLLELKPLPQERKNHYRELSLEAIYWLLTGYDWVDRDALLTHFANKIHKLATQQTSPAKDKLMILLAALSPTSIVE